MKIVKPSATYLGTVGRDNLQSIEMAGRTCYRSEDKITPDSAEAFIRKLIKAGHLAMVEHSNLVIRAPRLLQRIGMNLDRFVIAAGKYLNVVETERYILIGGSLTAWYRRGEELGWIHRFFDVFLMEYGSLFDSPIVRDTEPWEVCPHDEIPRERHRHTVRFTCDRGVSHELVRHRPCSFAQESTRYVRYDDIEVVEPDGWGAWDKNVRMTTVYAWAAAQAMYQRLIDLGRSPQQARAVLPTALRTEIVVTADAAEWRHIHSLRTAAASHPDMRRVMAMVPWGEIL